jgi:heme-degrading monooxygenase HmoA
MVVRATEAEIDVVRTNPADAIAVFREAVIPALHEEEGYEGCYVLLSEEGKMLVLSFWTSDETARASRLSGFYEAQVEKFSDLVVYRQAPGREAYDVVIAEVPQEAVVQGV